MLDLHAILNEITPEGTFFKDHSFICNPDVIVYRLWTNLNRCSVHTPPPQVVILERDNPTNKISYLSPSEETLAADIIQMVMPEYLYTDRTFSLSTSSLLSENREKLLARIKKHCEVVYGDNEYFIRFVPDKKGLRIEISFGENLDTAERLCQINSHLLNHVLHGLRKHSLEHVPYDLDKTTL